jgi:hypothetical protein
LEIQHTQSLPVIPALRRLRQEDLSYTMRPYLKEKRPGTVAHSYNPSYLGSRYGRTAI